MDIRMPELDGIEATRQLVATAATPSIVRVLILTTFDLDEYVYDAMKAGASGFLLKDTPAGQLAAGIRTTYEGGALFAPGITRRLIEAFADHAEPPPAAPALLNRLTERELDVLRLMARGLSNAEIGRELFIGENTVKTHVTRVFMKLELRDRVQAVVFAYEAHVVNTGTD